MKWLRLRALPYQHTSRDWRYHLWGLWFVCLFLFFLFFSLTIVDVSEIIKSSIKSTKMNIEVAQKMVGFTLKKDKVEPKKGFGFSLKSQTPKLKSRKPFGPAEDEEVDNVVSIDTVDSEGQAYKEVEGPRQKKELVIPNAGNTYKKKLEALKKEEIPEETKLEYGINFIDDEKHSEQVIRKEQKKETMEELTGEATTLEEYEEVPVEDFGAAMLRGMGWKGDNNEEEEDKTAISVKKRTLYLGLGAKDHGGDDKDRMEKSYIPVKLMDKRTGRVVKEPEQRDQSPTRNELKYRDRN
jgi:hypothetical protein